jgi:hypothetical protein
VNTKGDEPTPADVQHQHPEWTCWRAALSGTCYARRAAIPYRRCYQIQASDPASLRNQIRAADHNPGDDLPLLILGPPYGPDLPPAPNGHHTAPGTA